MVSTVRLCNVKVGRTEWGVEEGLEGKICDLLKKYFKMQKSEMPIWCN